MTQLSNKIQIPIKTKIAAVFAGVMGSLYTVIFFMAIVFDSDFSVGTILFYLPVAFAYGFAFFGLLRKWKIGWYAGLAVFGVMSIFFITFLFSRDFAITDILFLLVNLAAFAFLLIDLKNYFAVVERGNGKTKGVI